MDTDSSKLEAIKVFFHKKSGKNIQKFKKRFVNQTKLQAKLNHPNIIKINHSFDSILLFNSNGIPLKVSAIILDYVEAAGDLNDIVQRLGQMPEALARTYFHCIIDAIEHMQEHDVIHGNLVPENILFDTRFNLKISGFGNARKSSLNKPMKLKFQEANYYPPEVYYGVLKQRIDLDVFAAAMLLFFMIFGHLPFSRAELDNPIYKLIVCGEHDKFWRIHEDILDFDEKDMEISDEFKELIERVFDPNPDTRATIAWIKHCAWYNGPLMKIENFEKLLRHETMGEL